MNFKAIILSIIAFFSRLFSNPIQAQPIDLSAGDWKIQMGDSMEWAIPQYNDENWQKIKAGVDWKSALNIDYQGIAWYRKSVFISSDIKN